MVPSQDKVPPELEATRQSTSGFFPHAEMSMPPREPYIDDGNHKAPWRHTPSMQDLVTEVAIQIAGHLTATSDSPMDDLRSLWATCPYLRGITCDCAVGQRIDVLRFAAAMLWNDCVLTV